MLFHLFPKGYDGGDCCACTCESETLCGTRRDFGGGGYNCVDPSAQCEEEEEAEAEDESVDEETGCNDETLGDSVCDEENNNEACGESTCRHASCSQHTSYHSINMVLAPSPRDEGIRSEILAPFCSSRAPTMFECMYMTVSPRPLLWRMHRVS